MFTKTKKITSDNGCVFLHHPNQNDVTFCALMPIREGDVVTIVTAIRSNGKYIDDMEGGVVKYFREAEDSCLRKLATINFPNGIPEDYLHKLETYQCEEFEVEYYETGIVKV